MKLVCVVGPTGCGKTWLGVELAKMLGGEVVSCDSMQIYRGMVAGTRRAARRCSSSSDASTPRPPEISI